jgi:general secretion pathway protein E
MVALKTKLPTARQEALRSGQPISIVLAGMLGQVENGLVSSPSEIGGAYLLPDGTLDGATLLSTVLADHEAKALNVAAIQTIEGIQWLLMTDPWNDLQLTKVLQKCSVPLKPALATPEVIAKLLAPIADLVISSPTPIVLQSAADTGEKKSSAKPAAASNVVAFVDALLLKAWQSGASDLHFETDRQGVIAKLRLDGVLQAADRFEDAARASEVISRIKVLAALDIAETRIPQDGRFRARLGMRDVDFRVSIMPSALGEDAVLRLLDKAHLRSAAGTINLASLGFTGQTRQAIHHLVAEPHGMLLVTGPTGSGKTTTLYAVLSEINTGELKTVTIEDPVEYELAGVLQIPINEKKGLTFATGLRSILRHDPDRILVGEIRDRETADIAVQAALTGHQVFTTVHANSAMDVISRFIHLDIDLFSFASAVNGVVAQRLVRLNCVHCVQTDPLAITKLSHLFQGDAQEALRNIQPKRSIGCNHCHGTGYKGRTVIAEVLRFDDDFREAIALRKPVSELKALTLSRSTVSLRQAALALVMQGTTTLEEVSRVVSLAQRT